MICSYRVLSLGTKAIIDHKHSFLALAPKNGPSHPRPQIGCYILPCLCLFIHICQRWYIATSAKEIKAEKAFQHKHGLVTSGEPLCKGVPMGKNLSSEARRRRGKRTDCKPSRGLITIRKSDGNWTDSWTCQHMTSLKALGLEDLAAEDRKTRDEVVVNLSVQKHACVGYSVDGRVTSSITRRCRFCCTEYCNQIEASFNAWCLLTENSFTQFQTAAEVNDDPFIIYFSRGREEANLDDVVRDTIRLSCSIEATCSDACKESEVRRWEFDDAKRPTVDKRWLPILKARII